MWVCKFRVYDKENVGAKIVRKTGVTLFYYPINYYIKGNRYYFSAVGIVNGSEKSVKTFFRELRKLKKGPANKRSLVNLEAKKNFFLATTTETKGRNSKLQIDTFYNRQIIHIKPAVICPDGWEEQQIASFDRRIIEKIISISRKIYSLKLSYLRQECIEYLGMVSVLPKVTDKQQHALELAQKHGYYEYPRKIDIKTLAKIAGLSFSTFHAHLRKAEKKIIPFFVQRQ